MRRTLPSPYQPTGQWLREAASAWRRDLPHELTRGAVATVLLTASLLKGWSLGEDYVRLGEVDATTSVMVLAELFAAILILVRSPGVRLWAGFIALFLTFAGVNLYRAWSGSPTCGCFGRLDVPPVWTLALDLALVAAMLAYPPRVNCLAHWPVRACVGRWTQWLAISVAVASLTIAGAALAGGAFSPPKRMVACGVIQQGDRLIFAPEEWVGRPLPILDLCCEDAEILQEGRWEIWIIDPDCARCKSALSRRSEELAVLQPDIRLAVFQLRHCRGDSWLSSLPGINLVCQSALVTNIFCHTPTCIRTEDSIVQSIIAN